MNKQNFEDFFPEIEKKIAKRDKKNRKKMKVSGAGVKTIAKIITDKSKINSGNCFTGIRNRGKKSK